jgi:methionyl aminopeptidase
MISKSRMKFAISKKFSTVSRGYVSPMRSIPPHILAPEYHKSGKPMGMKNNVYIASTSEIVKIRKSAKLARQILEFALSLAKTNRSTEEIDLLCHEEILRLDAYPSPINYGGFPKAICTSVNEVVCHGIPDDRKLREGDILSIDVSVFKDGYHGDNCGTVIVGKRHLWCHFHISYIYSSNAFLSKGNLKIRRQ